MPAEPPAARHRPRGLARRQGGCRDRLRVVAPDIDLRLFGILRDDPLVLGQHRINPGRGRATVGQFLDDPREQAEPALHAAKAVGLQDAQDAGIAIFGNRLDGQLPCRGCGWLALGEPRDQRPRSLEQRALHVRQGAVIPGRRNSDAACHTLRRLGEAAMLPQPPPGHAWFSASANLQPAAGVNFH